MGRILLSGFQELYIFLRTSGTQGAIFPMAEPLTFWWPKYQVTKL